MGTHNATADRKVLCSMAALVHRPAHNSNPNPNPDPNLIVPPKVPHVVFVTQIRTNSNNYHLSSLFSDLMLFTNAIQLCRVTNNENTAIKLKINCKFVYKLAAMLARLYFCRCAGRSDATTNTELSCTFI